MRIDHLAFRVKDRDAAADFAVKALGYKRREDNEFELTLEDGSKASCVALEPTEKSLPMMPFLCTSFMPVGPRVPQLQVEYHLAPELFISSGPPGSLIDNWVNDWTGGRGGLHHVALQVEDVRETMKEWISHGWLFTTDDALSCEDLTQVFSKPNAYFGIIFEFIERRGQHGFCAKNVSKLMASTAKNNP